MESSRISPRVMRLSSTVGTEGITARTAFDHLASQCRDTLLRHILGTLSTENHRGRIDATHKVGAARRGVVISSVVERFHSNPQRRVPVDHPRVQLLYR